MRNLLWQSDAWKEYEYLQAEKTTLKKVNKLLKDIMRNGYQVPMEKWKCLKAILVGMQVCALIRKAGLFSRQMKIQ